MMDKIMADLKEATFVRTHGTIVLVVAAITAMTTSQISVDDTKNAISIAE